MIIRRSETDLQINEVTKKMKGKTDLSFGYQFSQKQIKSKHQKRNHKIQIDTYKYLNLIPKIKRLHYSILEFCLL